MSKNDTENIMAETLHRVPRITRLIEPRSNIMKIVAILLIVARMLPYAWAAATETVELVVAGLKFGEIYVIGYMRREPIKVAQRTRARNKLKLEFWEFVAAWKELINKRTDE